MSSSQQLDKAGHDYWDKTWNDTSVPNAFDPYDPSLENTFYQRLDVYFQTLIAGRPLKILEIGCAQSLWPAYFKKYHNIDIDGLDYSEIGCRKTREMWDKQGLNGRIVCADMFAPPAEMIEQYDLVLSFGVVEHFEDTAGCLKACSSFAKPSGHVFTMIPNIAGIIGHIQKPVDRAVYDIHVPLTRETLIKAHEKVGMSIDDCRYFMSLNLNVVNSGRHAGKPIDKILRRALSIPTKLVWAMERAGVRFPVNSFTSPYIYALARP